MFPSSSFATTYTSRYAQFLVYLDTNTQFLAGMAGRLLDQGTNELGLQLRHIQTLLEGILGQNHVVVDTGLVDCHRQEQLAALGEGCSQNNKVKQRSHLNLAVSTYFEQFYGFHLKRFGM